MCNSHAVDSVVTVTSMLAESLEDRGSSILITFLSIYMYPCRQGPSFNLHVRQLHMVRLGY